MNATAKVSFEISMSQRGAELIDKMIELTDANTNSDVFRNALRLQMMLIRMLHDGKRFIVEDEVTDERVEFPAGLLVAQSQMITDDTDEIPVLKRH